MKVKIKAVMQFPFIGLEVSEEYEVTVVPDEDPRMIAYARLRYDCADANIMIGDYRCQHLGRA